MIKVGISGKIASGKSMVENIIQDLGFVVFDLDIISHDVLNEEKIKNKILENFATTDRKKIAEIVFNDTNQKKKLENIIHPRLKEIIFQLFEKYKNEKAVFISGALIFKTNFNTLFDKTIFVDANENIRLNRLMKRNNLSESEAMKRLNLQDDKDKADYIIENNDDLDTLKNNVEKVLKELNLQ